MGGGVDEASVKSSACVNGCEFDDDVEWVDGIGSHGGRRIGAEASGTRTLISPRQCATVRSVPYG